MFIANNKIKLIIIPGKYIYAKADQNIVFVYLDDNGTYLIVCQSGPVFVLFQLQISHPRREALNSA